MVEIKKDEAPKIVLGGTGALFADLTTRVGSAVPPEGCQPQKTNGGESSTSFALRLKRPPPKRGRRFAA
jgi:hypothetical protein